MSYFSGSSGSNRASWGIRADLGKSSSGDNHDFWEHKVDDMLYRVNISIGRNWDCITNEHAGCAQNREPWQLRSCLGRSPLDEIFGYDVEDIKAHIVTKFDEVSLGGSSAMPR